MLLVESLKWIDRSNSPYFRPTRVGNDRCIPRLEAFFNPDGEILGTIGINQWARLWDTETGIPLSPELPRDFLVNGADFSEDSDICTS